MANPVKGEVPVTIGDQSFTFVLGTYALAALERRMKMSWTKVFQKAGSDEWGIDDILATFHAGLLRHHRHLTEEQAADLIDAAGLPYVNQIIGEAVRLMLPAQAPEGGEVVENPPTNGTGRNLSLSG